jgi:hypothetical protein
MTFQGLITKLKLRLKNTPDYFYTVASLAALAAINYAVIHNSFVFIAIIVLLAHELGHYLTAKIKNIDANLPIFIPIPFLAIGVTKVGKHDPYETASIAISGPIYGFLTCILILLLNLIFQFTSSIPLIFLAITEIIFNYFGTDGKKYKKAKRSM